MSERAWGFKSPLRHHVKRPRLGAVFFVVVLVGRPAGYPAAMSELVPRLLEADRYARSLGVDLVAHGPGTATVEMTVTDAHLNFVKVAHGGATFSLADCAFSLASNSHGPVAVAIDTHFALTAAARMGDRLTATAEETTRGKQLATYRVTVSREDGRVVGVFTGTVFITGDRHDLQ